MSYYSFLKGKYGELLALKSIRVPDSVVPVIDLPRSQDENKKGWIDTQVNKTLSYIKKNWSKERLFLFDMYDVSPALRLKDSTHPISATESLLQEGYKVGYITGLDRDDDYINSTAGLVNHYNTPLAVRLLVEDISVPRITLNKMKGLISEYPGLSQLIIILDFRVLKAKQLTALLEQAKLFIQRLNSAINYDDLVVTGSSITASANDLTETGSSTTIPRLERTLWQQLVVDFDVIKYGDYTVISPEYSDLPEGFRPPITPKITYTLKDSFYFCRANSVNHNPLGYRQYILLAQDITGHRDFRHTSISAGEEYIRKISSSNPHSTAKPATGNTTTWITATVTQHIDYLLGV